ncbi:MAG TPA: hypothetical protein VFQ43_12570 [Nitrososphaera sp.]|nr:hypothetical protein [Nitrososphaera sp.]
MHITAERLLFFLGSLGVPGIIVVLNFLVRGARGWYYTAGTDFLVALMTFSFSSAILSKDMAPYIQNCYIREAANGIFLMLGLVILAVWIWTASNVEKEINDAIRRNRAPKSWPQPKLFVSWGCVITFFAAEIMAFVYR